MSWRGRLQLFIDVILSDSLDLFPLTDQSVFSIKGRVRNGRMSGNIEKSYSEK